MTDTSDCMYGEAGPPAPPAHIPRVTLLKAQVVLLSSNKFEKSVIACGAYSKKLTEVKISRTRGTQSVRGLVKIATRRCKLHFEPTVPCA